MTKSEHFSLKWKCIDDFKHYNRNIEGNSRLLEKAISIEEGAQVTGYRDLNILDKCTLNYILINCTKNNRKVAHLQLAIPLN